MDQVPTVPGPEEAAFTDDLAGGEYLAGEARGHWRLLGVSWPHAEFAVTAPARAAAPEEYVLRFELTGYLGIGVTAQVWDPERSEPAPPAELPGGGPADAAFNPGWPVPAIYIPTDRLALEGHPEWRALHPGYVWDPDRGIAMYLQAIHEILEDPEYVGVRQTA